MCPDCGAAQAACVCRKSQPSAGSDGSSNRGVVTVGRETKGRKGKGVTLVKGLVLEPAEMGALCARLKRRCGSGGTVKDGVIEIQGDHRDVVVEEIAREGWVVKRAGG